MSNISELPPEIEDSLSEKKDEPRKRYSKPLLEELGDLRTLTLGGSPGVGDSGGDPQFPVGFG